MLNRFAKTTKMTTEFLFKPNYIEILNSSLHYIDEGQGETLLFLHGNPSWSYIWRNVIPHVSDSFRCIAPDLIGMGRSGKPDIEYSFNDHYKFVSSFIEKLNLKDITLVLHDWGSAIGFHYLKNNPDKVKGVVFMEAILEDVANIFDEQTQEFFGQLRKQKEGSDLIIEQNVFLENILPSWVNRKLDAKEVLHYKEPYLKKESRLPLFRWPSLVPFKGEPIGMKLLVNNYKTALAASNIPKLLFYAEPGAFMPKSVVKWCIDNIKNLTTVNIGPGVHFLQEDNPNLIGKYIESWMRVNEAVNSSAQ
jgi:haloalkane dehalogenase